MVCILGVSANKSLRRGGIAFDLQVRIFSSLVSRLFLFFFLLSDPLLGFYTSMVKPVVSQVAPIVCAYN